MSTVWGAVHFVNLVITSDFLSIISDGQITTAGQISKTHFKKYEVSPQGYVIAATGFEQITNEIRKKIYYQSQLSLPQAHDLLVEVLESYKTKQQLFHGHIRYNALLAGFVGPDKQPQVYSFHIENQQITERLYTEATVLSLLPDDISFNPNAMIKQNLAKFPKKMPLLQVQSLQRNALYQVARVSKTVNTTVFQDFISAI